MPKEPSIRISEKHGLNPCISTCFICNKDKNEIALLGKLKGDKEAPVHAVLTKEPCDDCVAWMEKGVIMISVKDGEDDHNNPYRTGGWVVVKDEVIENMIPMIGETMAADVLKKRIVFLEDKVWDSIGMTRKSTPTTPEESLT